MSDINKYSYKIDDLEFDVFQDKNYIDNSKDMRKTIRNFISELASVSYKTTKSFNKDSCLIYSEAHENIRFFTYNPTGKMFYIFNGLYDTETGYLNMGIFKNRINIPALDLVYTLNQYLDRYLDLDELNNILYNFKLTLDTDKLCSRLQSPINNLSSYSFIKRNMTTTNKKVSYRSVVAIKNILIQISSLMGRGNLVYDYLMQKIKSDSLKIPFVKPKDLIGVSAYKDNSKEFIDYYHIQLELTTSRDYRYKILKKDNMRENKKLGLKDYYPEILANNFYDIIENPDLIYTSDIEKLLKDYGLDNGISEKERIDLVKSISDYSEFSVNNPVASNISPKSISKKKYTDNEAISPFTISSIISDIVIVNKVFRKIGLN